MSSFAVGRMNRLSFELDGTGSVEFDWNRREEFRVATATPNPITRASTPVYSNDGHAGGCWK